MVRKFPPFRSERKKRTTSVESLQFAMGFSGKLLLNLTFNRNFRNFFLNGKHPTSPAFVKTDAAVATYRLVTEIRSY